MNIPYPQRKPNRLREFDYSSNRAYFVTICTQDRKNTLCHIVGDGSPVPKPYVLRMRQSNSLTVTFYRRDGKPVPYIFPHISTVHRW